MQENSTLRREVEVLEHLLLKYQNELAKAKLDLSRSQTPPASSSDGASKPSAIAQDTASMGSPHRFRKAIKGGTSPKRLAEKEVFSGQIVIEHGKKYEHVVRSVEDSEVSWEFTLDTSAADIGFTVMYEGIPVRAFTRCKSNRGKFAPIKIDGTANKNQPVSLVFDNSFSIFRDKTVNLRVKKKILHTPLAPQRQKAHKEAKSLRKKKKRMVVID